MFNVSILIIAMWGGCSFSIAELRMRIKMAFLRTVVCLINAYCLLKSSAFTSDKITGSSIESMFSSANKISGLSSNNFLHGLCNDTPAFGITH